MPQMMQGMRQIANLGFGTDLLYAFVLIVISLMIYFGTRELYELSSHKGIKFFRDAFLFFALAYFFRSFVKLLTLFDIRTLRIPPQTFSGLTLFLFVYFSSLAILYLLYSVVYKKWETENAKYILHGISALIAIAILILRISWMYLGTNLLLFLIAIGTVYFAGKKSRKKKHSLYAIYVLLTAFWTLNILDILIPHFFRGLQFLIYIVSIGIFLAILYKVIKKTGAN